MMPPWYLRLWCWIFDHAIGEELRADPVIPAFWVCRRCGKYGRILTANTQVGSGGPRESGER